MDDIKKQEKKLTDKLKLLTEKREAITSDPANLNTDANSIWLYVRTARRKIDKIDQEIAYVMASLRELRGRPVPCDGYSGRQTNRR